MRTAAIILCLWLTALTGRAFAATAYELPAKRAAQWLAQRASVVDGSWGPSGDLRFLYTAEAVLALGAANQRLAAYYGGVAWLENHAPANVDFTARRILALAQAGNRIDGDLAALQGARPMGAAGSSAWGLSKDYQGAPLDTALAVQALSAAGATTVIPAAVAYLKSAQLSGADKGWPLAHEATSDPVTTAHVLQALVPQRATDPTLAAPIANGFAALAAKVSAASSVQHRALAVLAYARDNSASPTAAALLDSLLVSQHEDGSWGGDVYATSLALRALAAGMDADLAIQRQTVAIPDAALRKAINEALGRNGLDALNRGELAQLTTLDISARAIGDLRGLESAVNLTTLDARNNRIDSFAPIQGLPSLTTALLDGNPGYTAPKVVDVPVLPAVGAMLLGVLLVTIGLRRGGVHKRRA